MSATFGPGPLLALFGETTGRLQLWDLRQREPIRRLDEGSVIVRSLSFSPDGKLLLLSYDDGSLCVFNTDIDRPRHRLAPNKITLECRCQLHPTAPFAVSYSFWSDLLQVRDLGTGEVRVELKLPWRGSGICTWSLDGSTLAAADGNSGLVNLCSFDPNNPNLRHTGTLKAPGTGGTTVQFNSTGDRVAVRGWDSVVHLFDAVSGRLLFHTRPLPPSSWPELRFDPTGRRLAAARVGSQQQQIGVWSIADAREYRALIPHALGRRKSEWFHAVHPGGRLAALGLKDGLALFDLQSGRELVFVPIADGGGYTSFDGIGNLYTCNGLSCCRWPVRPDPARLDRLLVGPPEPLPFPAGGRHLVPSQEGRVVVQANFADNKLNGGGWVLHPNASKPRRMDKERHIAVSVSPDGRWVVFGPDQHQIKVYETATGQCVWQSPPEFHTYSCFSPDGRWLATEIDGGRVYSTGDWEPGAQLGPGTPWNISPDSRLVVMGQRDGVNRLVELARGRELARLEAPDQLFAPAAFTPDGTCLVVSAEDGLRVWDLRRIRRELEKLGLDWEAAPYPKEANSDPRPLEVKVVPCR